jgi:hypothetical protein
MATSEGNTTLTTLTGTLFPQVFMEAFTSYLQPLSSFTRDFSPTPAERGKTIKIPFVASQDAAVDFGTAGYVMQDSTAEGLDLTIDKHKIVSFDLTDTQIVENPQVSTRMFIRQKAFQLAKAVVVDVMSLITQANFGSAIYTGAASAFDSDDLVDIKQAVDLLDMPDEMRSVVLQSAMYNNLLKDSDVKPEYSYGSTDPIVRGEIPGLFGFDLYKSNIIPNNSQNLTGFVAYPDAIAIAMRYLEPQAGHDYAETAAFTDPDSGVTVGYRAWYDRRLGKMNHVMEAFYGFRRINGNSLRRFTSA